MDWGPPFRRKRGGGQSANHGQCQQNAEQFSCLSHFFPFFLVSLGGASERCGILLSAPGMAIQRECARAEHQQQTSQRIRNGTASAGCGKPALWGRSDPKNLHVGKGGSKRTIPLIQSTKPAAPILPYASTQSRSRYTFPILSIRWSSTTFTKNQYPEQRKSYKMKAILLQNR